MKVNQMTNVLARLLIKAVSKRKYIKSRKIKQQNQYNILLKWSLKWQIE